MAPVISEESRVVDCLMIECPVCVSDSGDTLGVTGRQASSPSEEFVVMRCVDCGTVYLEPTREATNGVGPACLEQKDLLKSATLNPGSQTSLRQLIDSRSNSSERLTIYSPNVEAWVFRAFGGRHWVFYDASAFSEYYSFDGVSRLVGANNCRLVGHESVFVPGAWTRSLKSRVRDWGWHWSIEFLLTGPWLVPQLVASVVEFHAQFRGRGAVMRFDIERPR